MPKFRYNSSKISSLERYITRDRLTNHLAQANGDRYRAIKLYERNVGVSASFYGPLQAVEVALRNAIDETLRNHFGQADWWNHPSGPLRHPQTAMLQKALQNLTVKGKPHTPGRIVAELSFGFWVGLVGKQYNSHLWIPALHKAFPNAKLGRKKAHQTLEELRIFRNRIAHHEPILYRPLGQDFSNIETVLGWICADTASWMRSTSCLRDLYLGTVFERFRAKIQLLLL